MRSLLLVVAFFTVLGRDLAASPKDLVPEALPYHPWFKYLEAKVGAPVYQLRFQRNDDYSKLLVSFYFRRGTEAIRRTLVFSEDGISELPGYALAWYRDVKVPVFRLEGGKEWFEGEGKGLRFFSRFESGSYVFTNGSLIPFESVWSNVIGVHGGNFVIIKFRQGSNWIVSSTENPSHALFALPSELESPGPAYAVGEKLIIFGFHRPPSGGLPKCLVYQSSRGGYSLSEEIKMEWADKVYDMDTRSNEVWVAGKGQILPGYYRFSLQTQKRVRLGTVPADHVFLLKRAVIEKIHRELRNFTSDKQ